MSTAKWKVSVVGIMAGTALVFGMKNDALAAQSIAQALQKVIAKLDIAKVSDLDFGEAPQGDVAKTVAPGASENGENASFNVVGEPDRTFTISLPEEGTVKLETDGGGAANKEIAVSSFASFPATTGQLSASGSQMLFVGATRAALLDNQQTGSYSGSFTVEVIY